MGLLHHLADTGWEIGVARFSRAVAILKGYFTSRAPAPSSTPKDFGPYVFGGCPKCVHRDPSLFSYRIIGGVLWWYCETHRVKWLYSSETPKSWEHANEDLWAEGEEFLSDFREIEGVGPFPC